MSTPLSKAFPSVNPHRWGRLGWFVLVLLAALTAGGCNHPHGRQVITVTRAERQCDNGRACRYIVFTTRTTYENVDAPFEGKRNSSDVQGHLLPGHSYVVEVVGKRDPSWSAYPNILRIITETTASIPFDYA